MREVYILIISISIMVVLGGIVVSGFDINKGDASVFTNFKVVKAHMDSPSMLVEVGSTNTLIQKAAFLNTTTIYDTNQGYVVLDTTSNIGYIFYSNTVWFGLNPLLGIVTMFTALVIDILGMMIALNRSN
jgi:hypothetical protein